MQFMMNPYASKEYLKCKKRIIKVSGKGMVEVEPDMVLLSIGIVTKDMNPQTAQKSNEQISERVISALLQAGIAREDIKTSSYTIYPDYDFIEGKQILTGYNVTHILDVKVRDISMAGEIINIAIQNGANQINRVEFTLQDAAYYYNRALKLAVKDAGEKAQALATTMKVSLDTVPCQVVEQSISFTPFAEQGAMKLAAAQAVMPGRIEITAIIEAEFEYFA